MKLEIWDEAKLKLQFSGRVLVNTSGEHFKFWAATDIINNSYIAHWGRIGKTIQSKHMHGNVESKIREKIRKGYREI